MNGDICPVCKLDRMPKIPAGSMATARQCSACGHVEEIHYAVKVVCGKCLATVPDGYNILCPHSKL